MTKGREYDRAFEQPPRAAALYERRAISRNPTSTAGHEIAAAGLGLAAALGLGRALRHAERRTLITLAAGGLTTAAAVYPLARSAWRVEGAAFREIAGLAAFGVLSLLATRRTNATGARLLAAGWGAHAVFDAYHETGSDSRVPTWYPAACAGFDLALAAVLLADEVR